MAKISKDVIDAAQASERKYGIPASVSLAQFGLESAWGTKMPPDSNNPFGIKAVGDQPFVKVRTREVDKHGRTYYINAPFRKFKDFTEAFDLHGKLLAQGKPYANARKKLPDPDAFAHALTGVYATDPKYGELLVKIMRGSKLYQYNRGSAPVAPELLLVPEAIVPEPVDTVSETAAANNAELARVAGVTALAKSLSRNTVNEVLAQAPAGVVEHATEAVKLKLGEKSTWIGGAIAVGSVLADPTVQAALKPAWQAIQHGSWGGLLSAAIGIGLVIVRSKATPRTDAVLAAKRIVDAP